ncbi:MAG: PASTA domain-containing protein [Gaiellaceae bacterium]
MTAYVEECRQEWRRLGVPELLAEEMATELESDLAEAQADGVSATEILGESDPRRFAATWASERGLVSERPRPKRNRKRLWFALAVVLVLGFVLGVLALVSLATTGVHTSGLPPAQVPELVGMPASRAVAVTRANGLDPEVTRVAARSADVVIAQAPAAGARVSRGSIVRLRVGRR